jgi:hypothetical protein
MLRWSLAVVLGGSALLLLVHGAHDPIHVAIGAAEVAGALLLVVPRSRRLGGVVLLTVLAAAAVVHVLHGLAPPLAFVVYAAATLVALRGDPT